MKRKISSSLTIDETAARLNGFQYGSRVIPQVTWFYADSLLSCRSKSYETVLLHYGNGFSKIKFKVRVIFKLSLRAWSLIGSNYSL